MTITSKYKTVSVFYILLFFVLSLIFFCRNLYLQLSGSNHAMNLFRKISYTTGTTLTTSVFGLLLVAMFIFEFRKKFTVIALSEDNIITYRPFLQKKRHVDIHDILSIHSIYEISRVRIFQNELLVLTLKTGKIYLSKMYLRNFDEIKSLLTEKINATPVQIK